MGTSKATGTGDPKNDVVAQAPDQAVTPSHLGGAPGDYVFAIYNQLSNIQGAIGELKSAQAILAAAVKESEGRLISQIGTIQTALSAHVKESEARLSTHISTAEARVSTATQDVEKRATVQLDKVERAILDRTKDVEGKVSALKERVNKVLWTGGALGTVVAASSAAITAFVGWKTFGHWIVGLVGG